MPSPTVLVIDADKAHASALQVILEYLEYEPLIATDRESREAHLRSGARIDVAVLGPGGDASDLLDAFRHIKRHDEHLPVVTMTQRGTSASLPPEVEGGSVANVELPLKHSELQNALQRVRVYRESRHLSGGPRSLELFRNLVGTSPAIRRVRQLIEQVAGTDASILLSGESGTGKEVVARNIHYQSKRRYKPFVPVNCGAIHPSLLESELFGHEKGAFTGAISTRRGRFEMADGGTLFLDEIGDMPLEMQVKLLRVIEERCFEHVGSNRSISMDVRIIAASHVDLDQAIEAGRFREDLYYRLSVFPIQMPSLSERIEDLPLLINDLVNRLQSEKRGAIQLTPRALESLSRYRWPGNVRELANLIERLLILFPDGVVDVHDLPEKYRAADGFDAEGPAPAPVPPLVALEAATSPREGLDLKEHLIRVEQRLIEEALEASGGVVARAARRLNLGRTTLVEKMRKLGIERPQKVSNL